MALTVSSASTSFCLTTLTRVRQELQLSPTETDMDDYLTACIHQASDIFSHETNRVFAKQTYLETLKGNNKNTIMLSRFPIISIDKVVHRLEYVSGDWDDTNTITGIGTTLSTAMYDIEDANSGIIYKKYPWMRDATCFQGIKQFPIDDRHPYQVTYKAGWVLPSTISTAPARTLPYDIEGAAVQIVAASFYSLGRDPLSKSERTGDAQYTLYDVPYGVKIIHGLPPAVYRVIEKYSVSL